MPLGASPSHSANDTRRRRRNSSRQSPSTAIRTKGITFMPVPVSSRASSRRQPHCLSVSRKLILTTTNRRPLLLQIYESLGRKADMESAARRAVERSENELVRQPENPRPAYLGAAGLIILGDKDRAREWLARALTSDPDDVWTQYNVACLYTMLGETGPAFDLLERLLRH